MSASAATQRLAAPAIRSRKGVTPIVCLTAYTAPVARLVDRAADLILVGDSVGMVLYGLPSTLGVSVDMMAAHGAAVVRATERACVVVDLPFGSYQESPELAFRNAARLMAETGCGAVKLEGGQAMAPTIRFLVERGVPVMGHVGLMPQSVNVSGGFRATGRSPDDASRVLADARAVAEAGAFALVVEGTVEPVARAVTQAVPVPTIGIGASVACDGQILVTEDMLGFSDFTPRHVRRYADLGSAAAQAIAAYAEDVRARRFPAPENTFAAVRRA